MSEENGEKAGFYAAEERSGGRTGFGLGGGLKLARHQYLMQTATLSAEDKQHRTVLEHAMEKTVSGLPADIQAQARINFYRSQIRHIAEKYDISAEHDTGMER